jgi:hypothetical protein
MPGPAEGRTAFAPLFGLAPGHVDPADLPRVGEDAGLDTLVFPQRWACAVPMAMVRQRLPACGSCDSLVRGNRFGASAGALHFLADGPDCCVASKDSLPIAPR